MRSSILIFETGTEFAVYDDGQNPKDIKSGRRETARKQLGICLYASNVLGSRGPRKMRAAIPLVSKSKATQEQCSCNYHCAL